MMPSPPFQHRTETRYSGRFSTASTPACAGPQLWPVAAPQILSTSLRSARSRQHARPRFAPKRSNRQPQPNLPDMPTAAKSP